jgi:hypothetical protein
MVHRLKKTFGKEQICITNLCRKIGFTLDAIKKLLTAITLSITGKLFSPEHNRHINAKDLKMRIEKEPENPNKLYLTANGMNVFCWFIEKLNIETKQRKGVRT